MAAAVSVPKAVSPAMTVLEVPASRDVSWASVAIPSSAGREGDVGVKTAL